ncbi:MAG: PhnD/SsuA/transferrin family substrate-binding protein [Rhodoferax sp.]|uniref:PhnD/SsuA/transferrin family substrate-binding protein n=1 Tax=Rhodoferax sp. TaxID=50421 RepID=UPI00263A1014|nr:PhnD/SsuA/transferrin family substrate-binding protein [Rhodoferax sp.]MDD2881368.1 PhnD/SsuA/transferrin family substrate-binding protein [Rhodoferax sp.]
MLRHLSFLQGLMLALLLMSLGARAAEDLPAFSMGFYLPVIRDVPRKDVEISMRFWIEELVKDVKLTSKPVQMYERLADMRRDLDSGKINFVVATAMGLAQSFRAEDLADGFSGYKAKPDDLMLLVRRDAGIHTPADLTGKRLSLLEGDELTNVYLPILLMQAGQRGDLSQLGSVTREATTPKQVHSLFFGNADAALVYRNTYEISLALNPQIGQRLEVLDRFTFKTRSPYISLFSSRVSPQHREQMTASSLSLSDSPRVRQMFQIYHSDVMERTRVQDLKPYYELLQTYNTLNAAAKPVKKAVR